MANRENAYLATTTSNLFENISSVLQAASGEREVNTGAVGKAANIS